MSFIGYVCALCSAPAATYTPECPACGKPNTLRYSGSPVASPGAATAPARRRAQPMTSTEAEHVERRTVGLRSVDVAFGGGVAVGKAYLLSGPEGAGKSSLALRVAAAFQPHVCYFSNEETREQVVARAARVGALEGIVLLCGVDVADIEAEVIAQASPSSGCHPYKAIVVDSLHGFEGGDAAAILAARRLLTLARTHGLTLVCLAHLTKSGVVRGASSIGYLFDAQVRLSQRADPEPGEPRLTPEERAARFLTTKKNRFGPDGEWMLNMGPHGLEEPPAPRPLATVTPITAPKKKPSRPKPKRRR